MKIKTVSYLLLGFGLLVVLLCVIYCYRETVLFREVVKEDIQTTYDYYTALGPDITYEDVVESHQRQGRVLDALLHMGAIMALLMIAILWMVTRRVVVPISALVKAARGMSISDMDIEIPYLNNRDEIGDAARALKTFRDAVQESDRLKSEFLATISHEIRTPMNGILGMAELLLRTELDKRQAGYASTIITSGETLLDIINDILDFSKIEAGRMELDLIPVNMQDVVDDIGSLYAVKAREKALEMVVRYIPGTPQFVLADPLRMRQVLGNLINNAVKFTDKGHIVITVMEDKSARLPAGQAQLLFHVEDTGIGIAPEVHHKIFQKFRQADASTTRQYGGTGLGLSICRHLVEMMGGRIGVNSMPGTGSTFWFSIPFQQSDIPPIVKPHPPLLRSVRVLVVDDLPVIRTMLAELLEEAGMIVTSASGGHEALHKLKLAANANAPYDIAILDYLMPEMNGEMLAHLIKDDPALKATCLIMLTAAGTPTGSFDFAEKGFSAYLSKPVQGHVLVETIAYVWEKFAHGQQDILIRVDGKALERKDDTPDIRLDGAKILLAEDSRVNQMFVTDILEDMGCAVTIVPDGRNALESLRQGKFDLVLMDCQMPVMDGFEATAEIIKMKKGGLLPTSLPVVALTANAMKGDRERCLQSGMQDYLSKPVRRAELQKKIAQWLPQYLPEGKKGDANRSVVVLERRRGAPAAEAIAPQPESGMIDPVAVMEARQILQEKFPAMVTCYIEDVENYLLEIRSALALRDIQAVVRPAHTIKSSSRQMGASRMADAAKEIEFAARALANGDRYKNMDYIEESARGMEEIFVETKFVLARMANAAEDTVVSQTD